MTNKSLDIYNSNTQKISKEDSGNFVSVTCIENIFDPHNSQKVELYEHGETLAQLISKFNPIMASNMEVVVSIDGMVVEEDSSEFKNIVPAKGSNVVYATVPQGGGGGGKNPLSMVAMLAVTVVAAWAAPALVSGIGYGIWGGAGSLVASSIAATAVSLTQAALTVAGGMLVSSVFGSSMPDVGAPNIENVTSTPTYGWERDPNQQEQGVVVPVLYGRHRVTPPIINSFITTKDDNQIYNALYCIADHKIDAIENVYINDNPASNYKEITLSKRYGEINQGIIPAFSDVIYNKSVDVKLSTDWSQTETDGNAVNGIGVNIFIPALYYANDAGGLSKQTITLNIQYRKKGTEDWNDFVENKVELEQISFSGEPYWSVGYPGNGGWVEVEAGSSVRDEHAEGERYASDQEKCYWKWIDYEYTRKWIYVPMPSGHNIKKIVQYKIDPIIYKEVVVPYSDIIIRGATQDPIRRDYYAYDVEPGKYEVRARLKNAPPTGTRYGNDTYFSALQEIIYDDFTYPGTALLGLEALATDQLSGSAPTVSVEVERENVRVWTGEQYEDKPANNPAWACYDILHNDIYGGSQPVNRFLLEDFEEWADYCEENKLFVNIYVAAPSDLRSILDAISVIGHGSIVHKGSQYGVVIDKKEEISVQHFMYTKGNMIEGTYSNALLDTTDRANAVEVTYFDQTLDYSRQIIEVYQSGYDREQTVINKNSVTLVGCVDREQAIKYGKRLLLQNRYLTQIISFEAGIDSITCFPGQVIDVSHDVPQWGLSSGRILSATSNGVKLPEKVELLGGEQYAIQVRKSIDDSIETVNIVTPTVDTTTDELTLNGTWESTPEKNDLYAFGKVNNVTKKFRVTSITRSGDEMTRRISAIEYVPEIYGDLSGQLPEVEVGESKFVSDLSAKEVWVFANDGTGKSVISVEWNGKALSWNVFLKSEGKPWEVVGQANKNSFRIEKSFTVGKTYQVSVSPYNTPDLRFVETIYIKGKQAPPSDVLGFSATSTKRNVTLTWDHIPDVDLLGYNIVEGVDYNRGRPIATGITENEFSWEPAVSGTYTFWIKAVDRTFNESVNAASAQASIDISDVFNIVVDREEIPVYVPDATLYNLYNDSLNNVVSWIPGMVDTDVSTETDVTPTLTTYNGNFDNGVYTSDIIDLGTKTTYTLRQYAEKDAILTNPTDTSFIYGRTDITFPLDTDMNITSLAKYKLKYRYSDDGVSYSDWNDYTNISVVSSRYLQVRAETDIRVSTTNYNFTSIYTVLDVDDKVKKLYNQTIADTGTEFLLSSVPITIYVTYNVGVTVLGAGFATYSVDIQSDRFIVYVYDVNGNGISRDVNLEISGY
jgi:predicted phage tail protein